MCARFTVLSDTPIAAAIAGCVIPLSRNSTIWMRWRCVTGIFHRSAVFSRRTSALLHLTICCPESDGASESHLGEENSPRLPVKNLDSSRYGGGIRSHPLRIFPTSTSGDLRWAAALTDEVIRHGRSRRLRSSWRVDAVFQRD